MTSPKGTFEVILDHQSREEEAINGTNPKVEYKMAFPRFPFVLLLDGIVSSPIATSMNHVYQSILSPLTMF